MGDYYEVDPCSVEYLKGFQGAPPGLRSDHNLPQRGLLTAWSTLFVFASPAETEVGDLPLTVVHEPSHSEISNERIEIRTIKSEERPAALSQVFTAFPASKGVIHLAITDMDRVKNIIRPMQRGKLMVRR